MDGAGRAAPVDAMNLEALAAALSHDLRSPPRRIQAFAALLRDSLGCPAGSEASDLLESVESNARETSAMITELLGLVRLAMAPLAPEPVDLEGVVRAAWEKARVPGGQHALRTDSLPRVMADRELLGTAVGHLLANAVKFSAGHASPLVEVTCSPADSVVQVRIADNGVGFDERNAARLFRPFSRLHSSRDFAGRGMGLACAELIVRRHGGRIWGSSAPGTGARFDFTLPAVAPA